MSFTVLSINPDRHSLPLSSGYLFEPGDLIQIGGQRFMIAYASADSVTVRKLNWTERLWNMARKLFRR